LTGFFYFQERGSNQREFDGKDFPHVSGENTRGLALSLVNPPSPEPLPEGEV